MALDFNFSAPWLCAALDQPDQLINLRLAEKVAGEVDMLKVNDDAVDGEGLRALVTPFLEFGLPLFVDMKMLKGARTMARRAQKAAELGVAFINAYALADRLLRGPVQALVGTSTRLLAVTVLTHHDDAYCRKYHGRSLEDTVRLLSETAVEFRCHGIILPAPTLHVVADLDIEIRATPGIRPEWHPRKANDQESTSTPAEAVRGGSKILIVGGPIAEYPDGPAAGARRIREEMMEAWARLGR